MIAFSSSGFRPVLTSASMPRPRKMSAACGLMLSEMRTLGMVSCSFLAVARCLPHPLPLPRAGEGGTRARGRVRGLGAPLRGREFGLDVCPGPVEPGEQRLQIAGLDGGAGPQPEARRRVAVGS